MSLATSRRPERTPRRRRPRAPRRLRSRRPNDVCGIVGCTQRGFHVGLLGVALASPLALSLGPYCTSTETNPLVQQQKNPPAITARCAPDSSHARTLRTYWPGAPNVTRV